ncbi:MAG: acyl-CoA dehydrogenase family protein, partial [Solirubrobacterales bacterium]
IDPENHEQLQQLTAEFNDRVVRPVAYELEKRPDPEDSFSWEIIEEASKAGLRTLTLDPEYGGPGVRSLGTAIVIEELGKADIGISVVMAQTLKLIQSIQGACNQEQKDRVLPQIRDNERSLLAIGFTEPETASNYIIPFDDPGAGYSTTAVKADGGWVVNGFKQFISNGNRASHYLLFAATQAGASVRDGTTCFLVESGTDGFTTGTVHDKFAERLANNAELIFEDCFIPDENVVGEVHGGFDVQARFFPASNTYAAATVLGAAADAYERALSWTRHRVQGGKPLIEHDSVAAQLAEMRMHVDATRAYVRHAAWAADHRDEGAWDPTLGAFPKVLASQMAWKVTTMAMELHGAYGFMKDKGTQMDKQLRDSVTFLHSDGANLSLLLKAAKAIRAEG